MESPTVHDDAMPVPSRACLLLGQILAACTIPAIVLAADTSSTFNDVLADIWLRMSSLICIAGFLAAVVVSLLLFRKMRQHTEAENRLKDLLAFQTGVLDSIPQPIGLRDEKLNLRACNSAYERLLMEPKSSLLSSSLEHAANQLGCADTLNQIRMDYQQVIASGFPTCSDREVKVNGREMIVQHWMEPLRNARGNVVGVVSGWLDITQRQRVLKELAVARDNAESANRTKTTFLASVSHEIRTPMNAIMGMLELTLMHPDLPLQDKVQLTTAYQSSKSLLALIDDLLDLSKMEAGKFQLLPRPTDLCGLVEEVVDVFLPVAVGKGLALTLTTDLPPGPCVLYKADPLRVKQILNNFVSNAIRFTEQGVVHVKMQTRPAEEGYQWVSFSVSDTGVGIPPAALNTLLQPFVQVEQTRQTTDRGTGLGLSICDRLVKKMGGSIQIDSKLGEGTTMTATLLLPLAEARLETPITCDTPQVQLDAVMPLHVLVVDDQPSNVLLLRRQLEKLGHQVISAGNGQEALMRLERMTFDLVVCDCAMPVMDGYAFAQAVRQRTDSIGRLPILGYTAGAHEAELQRARNAGMNQVLVKPVDLGTLRRAITSVLPPSSVPLAPANLTTQRAQRITQSAY